MSGNNFGRSIFLLGTNRAGFKADLSASEVDARTASANIDNSLSHAGDGLADGVKKGAAEFGEVLQKTEQRATQSRERVNSELSKFGSRLAEGFTLGGGIAAADAVIRGVGAVAGFAGDAIFNYGKQLQNAETLLKGFTGSQANANDALSLARREADAGRGTFAQLANAIAVLQPAAKQSGESISELIRLTEILGASNTGPEGGIEGAVVALREAASGDFTSLAERFNLSRTAIAKLKEEGVPNIEIVRRQLDALGIGFSLVDERSRGVEALSQRLRALAQSLVFSGGGADVFALFNRGLQGAIDLLSSPEVRSGAQQFGSDLAGALRMMTDAASNPALRNLARDIGGLSIKAAGDQLVGFVQALSGAAAVLAPIAGIINNTGTAFKALIDLLPTGGQNAIGAYLEGGISPVSLQRLGQLAEFLKGVNDQEERRQRLAVAGGQVGQNTGPGSFPAAGPNPSTGGGPGPQPGAFTGPSLPPPSTVVQPIDENAAAANSQAASAAILRNLQALDGAVQAAAARTAGAYVRAFTQEQARQFADAGDVLRNTLLAAVGGNAAKLDANQLAQGYALVARAIAEIGTQGAPSAATLAEISAILGGSAGPIQQYLAGLAGIAQAQQTATATAQRLKEAQQELAIVTARVASANAQAQAGVRQAEAERDRNGARDRQALDDQRKIIEGINREAAETAQRYRDISAALQEQYATAQRAAQAAQAARSAQIEEANTALAGAQRIAQEHSAAFSALQSGDIAYWLALNGEIDESTRLIIERYRSEVEGKVSARNAAQDRADTIGAEGRARDLELLTKIRAARAAGNFEEAAALERQRELEQKRFAGRSEFAQLQARVAQDEVNRATKPVEDAARAQAIADATKEREAKKRVDELTAQDKAARASEAAALQAIQDQITQNDKLASVEARRYQDAATAAQDRLSEIQDRADKQKIADDAEIERQKQIAIVKTNANNAVLAGANLLAGAATLADQKAKDELEKRKEILINLQAQIKALDEFYQKYPGLVPPAPGGTPPPAQQSPIPGNVDDPNPNPQEPEPGFFGRSSFQRTTTSPRVTAAAGGGESASFGGSFLRASLALPGDVPPAPGPSRPVAFVDENGRIRPLRPRTSLQDTGSPSFGIRLPDRGNDRTDTPVGTPGSITGGTVIQNFHAPLVAYPDMVVSTSEIAQELVSRTNKELRAVLVDLASTGKPTFSR